MRRAERDVLRPWDILESRNALRTPWFSIRRYKCTSGCGQVVPAYYVHEAPDSVMCVCINEAGLLVLERQYRFPLRAVSLDHPAGSIENRDVNLIEAARRELYEETGFTSNRIEYLFALAKDPGFSASRMHVCLARNARRVNLPNANDSGPFNATESLSLKMLQPKDVLKAIDTGEMSCALCVAATLRVSRLLEWK